MRNSSKLGSSQLSKQELIDENEDLRQKLVSSEALSKARREIHHTMSGAFNVGYWEWDEVENRPAYLSGEMADILGMSHEALYKKYQCEEDYFDLVHPEDLEHYRENLGIVLNSDDLRGRSHTFRYRIIRPGGEVRHILELEYGKLEDEGVITRTFGAVQDVTDHQESTLALVESEQRYGSLFSKLPLGVMEQDWSSIKKRLDRLQSEGVVDLLDYFEKNPLVLRQLVDSIVITSGNDALLRIYRAGSLEEFIEDEENAEDWWGESWERVYASEIASLAGSEKISSSELKEVRMDGSLFETRLITSIVKGDEDTWQRIMTIVEDVTERKQFEIDLFEAKTVAEKANKAKTQFLSSMSHELRTPLNSVIGFAQILSMEDPDETLSENQKSYVDYILASGNHLLELIEQVLELNQIEAGKLSVDFGRISARNVLDESLLFIRVQARDKGVEILDDIARDNLPILWTDSTRLMQVLLNLLSNAVKYNRENGKVTLSCEETSERMFRISVTDTGIGISEDLQSDLFTPFERLGREGGLIGGTGIGLTITRQVMELLGGKIGFQSVKGEGSTFWIDIPISTE